MRNDLERLETIKNYVRQARKELTSPEASQEITDIS